MHVLLLLKSRLCRWTFVVFPDLLLFQKRLKVITWCMREFCFLRCWLPPVLVSAGISLSLQEEVLDQRGCCVSSIAKYHALLCFPTSSVPMCLLPHGYTNTFFFVTLINEWKWWLPSKMSHAERWLRQTVELPWHQTLLIIHNKIKWVEAETPPASLEGPQTTRCSFPKLCLSPPLGWMCVRVRARRIATMCVPRGSCLKFGASWLLESVRDAQTVCVTQLPLSSLPCAPQ